VIPEYSKILMPTDGSAYSEIAAGHAIMIAKSTGAKIFVLNVVNTDLAFHAGIHYSSSITELEKESREATGKIRKMCEENGVVCEEIVTRGQPADTIVRIESEIGADLIVIGSLGMTAIERVLVGSVSEKVLKNANCPVLLVRK
jgi:nucleotide-binding universal stress UspA family protein